MKILDPVHKYMYFSEEEKHLIDSSAFQRLRKIKQLGFTEKSFPSATHTRFSHSLGASYLAGLAFQHIFSKPSSLSHKKKEEFQKLIRVVALLHDIGHGPLSHSSEPKMPLKKALPLPSDSSSNKKSSHEDFSVLLIHNSDISDKLQQIGIHPHWVTSIIQQNNNDTDSFFVDQGIDYKPLLEQIIHSEIDVDRMDYLKRDSYFCGTYYGHVDFDWMIKKLSHHIKDQKAYLAIEQSALYTVEDFLLGHHHMHLAVYFHHKNILYDELLKKYFEHSDCQFQFPTDALSYIECTDDKLYECLKKDASNIQWAKYVVEQNPYKNLFNIQYTTSEKKQAQKQFEDITSLLTKNQIQWIASQSTSHIAKTFKENSEHRIYVIEPYTKKTDILEEKARVLKIMIV